jgi:hypothetical protein
MRNVFNRNAQELSRKKSDLEAQLQDGQRGVSAFEICRTYETAAGSWRHHLIDCMEAIMRERNSNSRMVLRTTAEGGKSYAFVLDFEFLSRTRSAMQTMRKSALGDRLNCHEPGHVLEFEFLSRILRPVQKAPPA